jgi:hypothetical protein
MTLTHTKAFSPAHIARTLADVLERSRNAKPAKLDAALNSNGDQLLRQDAGDLYLDDAAWTRHLHGLHGRDLRSPISQSQQADWRGRMATDAAAVELKNERALQQARIDFANDQYLDDAAWTKHLHSLHGTDLPDESEYRARERAFKGTK